MHACTNKKKNNQINQNNQSNKQSTDLGASPGGWSQIALKYCSPSSTPILAIDLQPIDPLPGLRILQGDLTALETQRQALETVGSKRADVVLSDMAHSFTGNRGADVARVHGLCLSALGFAEGVLKMGGTFVCKFIRGEGNDGDVFTLLLLNFFFFFMANGFFFCLFCVNIQNYARHCNPSLSWSISTR
jgi:23S rRNA U2552 (ribose-2'-O)-methylase RlmE/FtsJ